MKTLSLLVLFVLFQIPATAQVTPHSCEKLEELRVQAEQNPTSFENDSYFLNEIHYLLLELMQKTTNNPSDPFNQLNGSFLNPYNEPSNPFDPEGDYGYKACSIARFNAIDVFKQVQTIQSLLKIITINTENIYPGFKKLLMEQLQYASAFNELCKAYDQNTTAGHLLYSIKIRSYFIGNRLERIKMAVMFPFLQECN